MGRAPLGQPRHRQPVGRDAHPSRRQPGEGLELRLEDPNLAYLVEGTAEFDAYIADMLWAQEYARANRDTMMDDAMGEVLSGFGRVARRSRINCHHNFTRARDARRRRLWVTRKGAIKADIGDLGVIPGSMGTRSYIVAGKGNPTSWPSCSHGAGRRIRTEVKQSVVHHRRSRRADAGKVWLESKARFLVDEIRPRTRTSTRSWPIRPTSSRSCTRSIRFSTTRERKASRRCERNTGESNAPLAQLVERGDS